MLQVLCVDTELDEDGEVLQVGQHVSRPAARLQRREYYGTELDSIEWNFDRYADPTRFGAALVSGRVIEIQGIYVRLVRHPAGGWTAAPGTAHLEPVWTTAESRRPERLGNQPPGSAGGPNHEGSDHLSGWLVTLEAELVLGGESRDA